MREFLNIFGLLVVAVLLPLAFGVAAYVFLLAILWNATGDIGLSTLVAIAAAAPPTVFGTLLALRWGWRDV